MSKSISDADCGLVIPAAMAACAVEDGVGLDSGEID